MNLEKKCRNLNPILKTKFKILNQVSYKLHFTFMYFLNILNYKIQSKRRLPAQTLQEPSKI